METLLLSEAEVTQMLRDAIDQNPEGTVWHVNTKHLVAFAQMVADKTRREMSSPTEWDEYIYEQGEVKEDQKKADEAAWSEDRIACAAVRDAALNAAGEDSRAIATIYANYTASCIVIDDRWDAAKGVVDGTQEKSIYNFCGKHADWWPSQSQVKEMVVLLQKEWVGLTDDERMALFETAGGLNDYAKAIEAKLKEKNT